jgi:ribosomal-protein-alanine N-acetyltransferase
MRIRRGAAGDLPSILAAERACFSRDLAFPEEVVSSLLGQAATFVAEDGEIAGFVMGFLEGGWGKVVTLDVLPEKRGCGVARRLVAALEEDLASRGAGAVGLEVAVDNLGAIGLYSRLGYRKAARLQSYYGPGKDALLMTKELL